MDEQTLVNVLTSSVLGLIILGILGSILGYIIIYLSRKIFVKLSYSTNRYFKQSMLNKLKKYYLEGYCGGYAHHSSYHQILLVGKYIINIVINASFTICLLILASLAILLSTQEVYWIVVIFLGFAIVFPLYLLIRNINFFYLTYNMKFNAEEIEKKAKEYSKKKIEGIDKKNKSKK